MKRIRHKERGGRQTGCTAQHSEDLSCFVTHTPSLLLQSLILPLLCELTIPSHIVFTPGVQLHTYVVKSYVLEACSVPGNTRMYTVEPLLKV